MTRFTALFIGTLLIPCTLHGQSTTIEIGSGLGASILSSNGTITNIGVPGPGIGALGLLGQAPLYASFFLGNGFLIQPEISFSLLSGEGSDLTTFSGVANLGWAFAGGSGSSPYVTANGAWQIVSFDGDSESEFGAGARIGYRFVVNQGFAVSFEGGYRRWFDSDLNEILIGVRLGGILSSN
jgi:hypothetical protein